MSQILDELAAIYDEYQKLSSRKQEQANERAEKEEKEIEKERLVAHLMYRLKDKLRLRASTGSVYYTVMKLTRDAFVQGYQQSFDNEVPHEALVDEAALLVWKRLSRMGLRPSIVLTQDDSGGAWIDHYEMIIRW